MLSVEPSIGFCQVVESLCEHAFQCFHDTRGQADWTEGGQVGGWFRGFQDGNDDGISPDLRSGCVVKGHIEDVEELLERGFTEVLQKYWWDIVRSCCTFLLHLLYGLFELVHGEVWGFIILLP